MPKKLKELSKLTIGLRHRLVFEAVENYGLATISDVLSYVVKHADLDTRKSNVKATLKKTIENDLRSFIGGKGKLSVRYYHRDGVMEVPSAEIEENKDGTVKNKYCIKYYIIGGGIQVPGVSLLNGFGVQLMPPNNRIIKIKVDPAYLVEDSNRCTVVFEKNGNEFSAINFDLQDLPLGFLICGPNSDLSSTKKITDQFGLRTVIIKMDHISVERYLIGSKKNGHAYFGITEDQKIEIFDNGSLNGTYYGEISNEKRDLIFSSPPSKDLGNTLFSSYYPFQNKKTWKQVKSKICLKDDGYLVKTGEVIFYVGKRSPAVGGGGRLKVK
ncbi:MAG: hypothetical protein AABY64_14535 [Bdellovibrionota bacterium]